MLGQRTHDTIEISDCHMLQACEVIEEIPVQFYLFDLDRHGLAPVNCHSRETRMISRGLGIHKVSVALGLDYLFRGNDNPYPLNPLKTGPDNYFQKSFKKT
jgi:hypothetical protein